MKTPYFHGITNAVKALHYHYGKGDVKAVRIFADGRIEIDAQCTSAKIHTRQGAVTTKGNKSTVKMYRHQLTVKIV